MEYQYSDEKFPSRGGLSTPAHSWYTLCMDHTDTHEKCNVMLMLTILNFRGMKYWDETKWISPAWQSASSSNTGTIFSMVNKHRKWFLLFKRNYVSIKVSLFSLSSYELLEIIFVWCWVISSPICISIMNVVLIFSSYCRIKARTKSTMIKNSMNMR